MTPEQTLWQQVVFQAFIDATWMPSEWPAVEHRREKKNADAWIRGCGATFRRVCSMANLDPDFLSRAYVEGRVDPMRLRAHTKWARRGAKWGQRPPNAVQGVGEVGFCKA